MLKKSGPNVTSNSRMLLLNTFIWFGGEDYMGHIKVKVEGKCYFINFWKCLLWIHVNLWTTFIMVRSVPDRWGEDADLAEEQNDP